MAGFDRVYNPDVVVINEPEDNFPDSGRPLALTNPMILVEVHSNSTEGYDYAHKLMSYKQLLSVQHILYVSQLKPFVTVYRRTDKDRQWLNTDYGTLEMEIDLGDLKVPMRDVYRKVVFGESAKVVS